MISIIYLILSGACMTHLWLVSYPLEPIRACLKNLLQSRVLTNGVALAVTQSTNYRGWREKLVYGLKNSLYKLTECALCSGFWIGIGLGLVFNPICFQLIMNAALTSIAAELLHRKMTKINF